MILTKASVLRLHRYAGLAAAAFLLMQALTGCLLVYRTQAAQWIDPAGLVRRSPAGAAPVSRILAAAQGSEADVRVDRLFFPAAPDATYIVQMRDGTGATRFASIDPGDAAVLRHGGLTAFPVEAALMIHYTWLAGRIGTAVVILAGLALLGLAASGIFYWWPRRGRIRKSLAIQTHLPLRLVLRQLHRSTGVIVSLLLGFIAVTGLMLAIPILLDGTALPAQRAVIPANVDQALDLARGAFPGGAMRDVRLSADGGLAVNVLAPERNARAVHKLVVDSNAMRITAATPASADRALWVIALPLHAGDALGTSGHVLILLAGLVLAALSLTGPLMWWQSRRLRSRAHNPLSPQSMAADR